MKLYCSENEDHNTSKEIYKTREFNRAPDETHCTKPGCGARLETGMERNARKKAGKRGGRLRDESSAEQIARATFSKLVCEWPCFALLHRACEHCLGNGCIHDTGEVCVVCNGDKKHHCRGRRNAHHLVPVDWLRDTFSDLPEPAFLDIAYAPILGAPACQHNFHAAIEARSDFIYWHELDPELIDFCKRIEAKYPDRPSLLERLKLESPAKEGTR